MDISGIIHTTNITSIESIINDYNENMRYYNRNMRDLIEIYRERINDDMLRRRERQHRFYSRPIYNSIYDIYNSLNNPLQRNVYTATTELQDVIVRPTNVQIRLATENIIYDTSLSQHTCPISLESFEEGTDICRIKHCGHVFKRSSLMNWFQRNVRCPVCRYDIREYVEENESEVESEPEEEPEEEQDQVESTSQASTIRPSTNQDSITNIIRNFLTSEIQRNIPYVNNAMNELIFTFDIPMELDVSYNSISQNNRRR